MNKLKQGKQGKNDLSIIIPHYNREMELIRMLKSIFVQKESERITIILVDNKSTYDVQASLRKNFTEEELSRIKYLCNSSNYGAAYNVSKCFTLCKTKWMWQLSDDDIATECSLSKIFTYIEADPDIAYFKFLKIEEKQSFEGEENVSNLSDLISLFENGKVDMGNMIFMSNNVYNMELLVPYLYGAIMYSYTQIGHIIPLILALDAGTIRTKFIDEAVVTYKSPDTYNRHAHTRINWGLQTFCDLDLKISNRDWIKLQRFFTAYTLYSALYNYYHSSFTKRAYMVNKIYSSYTALDNRNCVADYFVYLFFLVQIKYNIDLIHKIQKLKGTAIYSLLCRIFKKQ